MVEFVHIQFGTYYIQEGSSHKNQNTTRHMTANKFTRMNLIYELITTCSQAFIQTVIKTDQTIFMIFGELRRN